MALDTSIFRAYDIRGVYPEQMNADVTFLAGQAFVKVTGAKKVLVGRDVRASGPELEEGLIRGITAAGADVIRIGVITTEMLYFAAGSLDADGGMSITASHNPAEWNGIKAIGKGATPVTRDDILGEVYAAMQEGVELAADQPGSVTEHDILPDYVEYLKQWLPADLPALKIVGNPNFGANGKVVDRLADLLDLNLIRLNWEEDGSFPKGTPDPSLAKNQKEISELVVSEGADLGIAWDADADRCFLYDNQGRAVSSYYFTALLIKHFLQKEPGAAVVIERRLTRANLDAVAEYGGSSVFTRVGHSYIKKSMREQQAVFGGESSGHFYFRDFYFCDNGIVPFLIALAVLAEEKAAGRSLSDIHQYYLDNYPISGELNYTTDQGEAIMAELTDAYDDTEQDTSEGLSVEYATWRFNLRMSATEPVIRLNVEAENPAVLQEELEKIQTILAAHGAILRNDT